MTHEVIALRTAAQQALEAWQTATYGHPSHHKATLLAMTALSTAVAQQAEPVQEPVDAHTTTLRNLLECCLSWEPDACVLGNVTARQAVTALRAALAQQAEPEACTWHQDGDSDSGVYATSCRRFFNLTDGTPEDNKMQWCCYCGKRLVQELITEDGDE